MCRSKTPTIGKLAKKAARNMDIMPVFPEKKDKIISVSGDFDELCCVVL